MTLVPDIANLEAWWELNEESGARVDSHGSNNLADNNTVLFGTGVVGNAADFELDNDEFLDIADNASLSFGDEDFTITCWVKAETLAAQMFAVSKWKTNDLAYNLHYSNAADRFRWRMSEDATSASGTVDADQLGSPSTGTWYFIVAVNNTTANTITIQVNNGTEDSSAHEGGSFDNASTFAIGANDDGAPLTWDGLTDEVNVWRALLTSAEKTWLYNSGNGRSYSEMFLKVTPSSGVATAVGNAITLLIKAIVKLTSIARDSRLVGSARNLARKAFRRDLGLSDNRRKK